MEKEQTREKEKTKGKYFVVFYEEAGNSTAVFDTLGDAEEYVQTWLPGCKEGDPETKVEIISGQIVKTIR